MAASVKTNGSKSIWRRFHPAARTLQGTDQFNPSHDRAITTSAEGIGYDVIQSRSFRYRVHARIDSPSDVSIIWEIVLLLALRDPPLGRPTEAAVIRPGYVQLPIASLT